MKKLFLFCLPLTFLIINSCTPDSVSGGGGVSSAPAPPSNLSVTVISSTQANLTWRDNSSNEDGFIIERKMLSNSYVIIATPVANSTTYSDLGLISHTDYTYRISSFNAAGSSAVSAEVMITTP